MDTDTINDKYIDRAACALGIILIYIIASLSASIPVKYVSTSTGKCVQVIIDNKICDCSILDEQDIKKYDKVYVK